MDDALTVLLINDVEVYPNVRTLLTQAKNEVTLGLSATSSSQRKLRITNALTRIINSRGQFGSNITFQLGQGNLMF
jgi:hypothetical protein